MTFGHRLRPSSAIWSFSPPDRRSARRCRKKYIDIAYVKAKRLEKLIEDLFGFTKMNYGRISMNVGKVDIVKLLGQLLEEFYPSFYG